MHWAPLLRTRVEGWTILVRLMVGLVVFLPEGIQKLAFPEASLLNETRFNSFRLNGRSPHRAGDRGSLVQAMVMLRRTAARIPKSKRRLGS
jgi:hypothetical protein